MAGEEQTNQKELHQRWTSSPNFSFCEENTPFPYVNHYIF